MGMMVALIAFAVGRMDRHIDGHAIAADQLLRKVAGDLGPVLSADLGGQGQLPLAGGDGVAAGLAGLDLVPETGAIRGPVRRVFRCQDEGLLDALLAGVIVDTAFALALDALPDTVGRTRFDPLILSANTLPAPAAIRASIWASRFWSSLLTLAYPMIMPHCDKNLPEPQRFCRGFVSRRSR